MPVYGYMWYNRCDDDPCKCLALTGVPSVYKHWYDVVEHMNDSLKRAEVEYEINKDCNPESIHTNNGEMVYATYENNYGRYIVKVVFIFE